MYVQVTTLLIVSQGLLGLIQGVDYMHYGMVSCVPQVQCKCRCHMGRGVIGVFSVQCVYTLLYYGLCRCRLLAYNVPLPCNIKRYYGNDYCQWCFLCLTLSVLWRCSVLAMLTLRCCVYLSDHLLCTLSLLGRVQYEYLTCTNSPQVSVMQHSILLLF